VPFDVRTPIGLLFTLYGALLAGRGALSGAAGLVRSLGLNVNLIWGTVLLSFGVGLLLATRLVKRGRKQP
jgi:hypothetical protein